MRYLLNSAVITAPGRWEYRHLTPAEAREWAAAGPWVSTIGYASTAEFLARILGVEVPVNRTPCTMRPGDEALVCRLDPTLRLPASAKSGAEGRAVAESLMAEGRVELGLLVMLPGLLVMLPGLLVMLPVPAATTAAGETPLGRLQRAIAEVVAEVPVPAGWPDSPGSVGISLHRRVHVVAGGATADLKWLCRQAGWPHTTWTAELPQVKSETTKRSATDPTARGVRSLTAGEFTGYAPQPVTVFPEPLVLALARRLGVPYSQIAARKITRPG